MIACYWFKRSFFSSPSLIKSGYSGPPTTIMSCLHIITIVIKRYVTECSFVLVWSEISTTPANSVKRINRRNYNGHCTLFPCVKCAHKNLVLRRKQLFQKTNTIFEPFTSNKPKMHRNNENFFVTELIFILTQNELIKISWIDWLTTLKKKDWRHYFPVWSNKTSFSLATLRWSRAEWQ